MTNREKWAKRYGWAYPIAASMAVISVNEIWEAMMFKRIDRVTILGLIALLASGSAALACGTERWPVKIGTDKDARKVATSPKLATIAQLRLIAAPARPNSRPSARFAPTELTTF